MNFFVMLNHPSVAILPLMDEDGETVNLFPTSEDAEAAAQENSLGSHYGYEVFERGCGCA